MIDENGWTALAAIVVVVVAIASILKLWPALGREVVPEQGQRLPTLDGLRGVLSLSVVMHHCIIASMVGTRGWTEPTANFSNQLGSAAVGLFFMVSAYLFCGSLISRDGRLNVLRLAESRVLRIVPLYLAGIVLLLVSVGFITEWHFAIGPIKVAKETARWLLFGFVPAYDINGSGNLLPLFGQVWTLRYEWCLYALLPVMALAARRVPAPVAISLVLIVATAIDVHFAAFGVGALVAWIAFENLLMVSRALSVAGVAALVVAMLCLHSSVGIVGSVLLGVVFLAALRGAGVFAVLSRPELRFIGEISYSLYLLHGFALYALVHATRIWGNTFSQIDLFALCVATGLTATALSTLTYLGIERPFLGLKPVTGRRKIMAASLYAG